MSKDKKEEIVRKNFGDSGLWNTSLIPLRCLVNLAVDSSRFPVSMKTENIKAIKTDVDKIVKAMRSSQEFTKIPKDLTAKIDLLNLFVKNGAVPVTAPQAFRSNHRREYIKNIARLVVGDIYNVHCKVAIQVVADSGKAMLEAGRIRKAGLKRFQVQIKELNDLEIAEIFDPVWIKTFVA